MTTEKELGEALKRGDSTIEVELDLSKKVVKIKTAERGSWALCVGAIGVAAVCGVVTISTAGTATVPSAFIATPAIATASGVLGMSTTISAIGIAIAGGGVGALNKLRGYRVEKLFCTKNKNFYGSKEVELENVKPITEVPLEVQKKMNKQKEAYQNGIERFEEECDRYK